MTDEKQAEILALLKSSLRIAGSEDDDMLNLMVLSAWETVKNMIGTRDEFFVNNSQFDLAVLQQATNNFLNRSSSSDIDLFENIYGMQTSVLHLKAKYLIWEQENAEIK